MTTSATSSLSWASIITDAGNVISLVAPYVEAAVPAAGPAIAIASQILQGVISAEPTAIALFNQFQSGTPPTPAQVQAYTSAYEADYQKLNSDINAKLAATAT